LSKQPVYIAWIGQAVQRPMEQSHFRLDCAKVIGRRLK
jgi:hypothetical protein